jgi:hypothetical protein
MKKSHRSLLAVLLLLSVPLLSACGTATVRQRDEVSLARRGLAATNLGPARSIDCPSGIAMKVGKTLDCHLKLVHGKPVTFTLKIDKVSGNGGHMTIVGAKQP